MVLNYNVIKQDFLRGSFQVEATKTNYPDEIVSAGQLLRILDSDAREISALCQRACLRPKKDGFGNIYFSKSDVDVLRKVKELYEHTKKLQEERSRQMAQNFADNSQAKENKIRKLREETILRNKPEIIEKEPVALDEDFLASKSLPTRSEAPKIEPLSANVQATFIKRIDAVENNVINKITNVLSEKLDGLDEVIVELIKAKTENETLRQKVNELNKENFALKTENSSFKPVGLGFYVKKPTDEFTF